MGFWGFGSNTQSERSTWTKNQLRIAPKTPKPLENLKVKSLLKTTFRFRLGHGLRWNLDLRLSSKLWLEEFMDEFLISEEGFGETSEVFGRPEVGLAVLIVKNSASALRRVLDGAPSVGEVGVIEKRSDNALQMKGEMRATRKLKATAVNEAVSLARVALLIQAQTTALVLATSDCKRRVSVDQDFQKRTLPQIVVALRNLPEAQSEG